jgi:mono/diheme cytochrome c family protein
MFIRKLAFIILAIIILAACGNNNKKPQKSVIVQPESKKEEVNPMAGHPGKKVYDSVCLACHMRNGTGVPGMHPPIAESEIVNGDPEKLIKIVLTGLSGEVEVKGNVYNNIMPPQAQLTDQQIADLLTFVRGSFGNNSGPVTPEQVKKVRNGI